MMYPIGFDEVLQYIGSDIFKKNPKKISPKYLNLPLVHKNEPDLFKKNPKELNKIASKYSNPPIGLWGRKPKIFKKNPKRLSDIGFNKEILDKILEQSIRFFKRASKIR